MNNYDITRLESEKQFLTYDIAPMVKKYGLRQDEKFTYIVFLGSMYRISKQAGKVERIEGQTYIQAGFDESMTIFDVLCYAKENATLSGEYCSVMQLPGVAKTANPGGDMFGKYANRFAGKQDALRRACEILDGTPYPVGEVAYQIPLFDFLPIVLQFWDADDEFPAQFTIKWDKNTLRYMHFETTFYAVGYLLERLVELDKGVPIECYSEGDTTKDDYVSGIWTALKKK